MRESPKSNNPSPPQIAELRQKLKPHLTEIEHALSKLRATKLGAQTGTANIQLGQFAKAFQDLISLEQDCTDKKLLDSVSQAWAQCRSRYLSLSKLGFRESERIRNKLISEIVVIAFINFFGSAENYEAGEDELRFSDSQLSRTFELLQQTMEEALVEQTDMQVEPSAKKIKDIGEEAGRIAAASVSMAETASAARSKFRGRLEPDKKQPEPSGFNTVSQPSSAKLINAFRDGLEVVGDSISSVMYLLGRTLFQSLLSSVLTVLIVIVSGVLTASIYSGTLYSSTVQKLSKFLRRSSMQASEAPALKPEIVWPRNGTSVNYPLGLVSGIAEPNDNIRLKVGEIELPAVITNPDGVWQVNLPSDIPEGQQKITLVATRAKGTQIVSFTHSIEILILPREFKSD